jgi:hypothetical protein
MNIDMKAVERALVEEMARIAQEEIDPSEMLRQAIEKRINEIFAECAERQIADAVNAAIRDGFDREYCRVNAFGQKASAPTTIRKELERLVANYWNTNVDKNGKPSDAYGATSTRAEWIMMQLVASDFKGEMKQHVADVAGGLKDGLRKTLHATVNELLSGVFHVRSADDNKNSGTF